MNMELRVKKVIAREYLIFIIPFTTIITVYYFYGGSRPNNFSGLIESIYYMAIDGSDGWGDDAGIYVPVCKPRPPTISLDKMVNKDPQGKINRISEKTEKNLQWTEILRSYVTF